MDQRTLRETQHGDGTLELAMGATRVRVRSLRPGVLLYVGAGFLSEAFYAPVVALAERELAAAGALVMLVDGRRNTAMDGGHPEPWTRWFRANRHRFRMHILVRTKLLAAAAQVANLLSGGDVLRSYTNVRDWEEACARIAPEFAAATPGED